MKKIALVFIVLLLLACSRRQEHISLPWDGDEPADSLCDEVFDLAEIEQGGELIALTLSGPDTYYDFHGRSLGLHNLLCQQFAQHLGVKLRMEVCRDTADLLRRLEADDADMAAIAFTHDSLSPGWRIGRNKPELAAALQQWFTPGMVEQTLQREKRLLTQQRVRRHVYSPLLSKGVISRYDALFKRYSKSLGWDWRLLAAQCYQESTFDPAARSWAGAQGLMQIMPATADELGLPRDQLGNPEANIEAATRYLKQLDREFSYIRDWQERQNMVLASYNGGIYHVRDAMRLAERDGKNPNRWTDVSRYILLLSRPDYYQDPLVQYGYMRGTETVDYVNSIRARYRQYRQKVR